ncbi:ATP-binding protein [Acuticoccus sp. M5D2P5]|uniref:sensor histidine kinase n=1 Tax=Acuticoccus kalidii TaxID=2910977 RepID=UPI001F2FC31F|nr:ATP-binding protein [Acuticoccus kalidii]MCF3936064.1 ATP-binding protein [Acuticoccus kalidii]
MQLSLGTRITLIIIAALIVGWLIVLGLTYQWHRPLDDPTTPSPQRLASIVELLETTQGEERARIVEALSSDLLQIRIERRTEANQLTARHAADPTLEKLYADALAGRDFAVSAQHPGLTAQERRFPVRRVVATRTGFEFRIDLATGETLIMNTANPTLVNAIGLPVGFGAGLIGTLIALIALIVLNREMVPLRRLASAADAIDLTGQPTAFPESRSSAPEIQTLVIAFNRLQIRLAQLLRARMAMIGGISHDVRTFATRLRLRLDTLPDGPEKERAINDVTDMVRLLDDALLASRAGAGELAEELLPFDEIIEAEVEDRRETGAPVDLIVSPAATGATILGDRIAIRRVASNLVDNALKYGNVAHVGIGLAGDRLVLAVDDEGAGIPEEMRDILLEPFVRLETSRSRMTGGAGLGLAIVQSLLKAHGGTLDIGEAPGGGARFIATLPRFEIDA